jgi:hypothetical protein
LEVITLAGTVDLIAKREEAYKYIRQTLISKMHFPQSVTNTVLARGLGGTFGLKDALENLQSGIANPTSTLVYAFKTEFQGFILESTINSYLVDPFE